jgi:Fuc2NAc and GlcNAc transferase
LTRTDVILLAGTGVLSFAVTYLARRYALAYGVLDIPNERSAHSEPMPRGGGVSIAVSVLAGVLFLGVRGLIEPRVAIAMTGSGFVVALVGFLDDHRAIEVHWRLLAHTLAAIWAVGWLGGVPAVEIAGRTFDAGLMVDGLAVIGVVWLLNLYNFMDGIDGIAGLEAVTAGTVGAVLSLRHPSAGHEWMPPAMLAAAALGFLRWNWPPARIFMGDVGSGFVGVMFGVIAVRSAQIDPRLVWVWVILLGVFVTDATLTLFRRVWREQKPHEAHHDHAYQRAARAARAHKPITLAAGAINVLWLTPVAAIVNEGWLSGPAGAIVAYVPLVCLAVRVGTLPDGPSDGPNAK